MRRMFTTADALADGLTASALRWGETRGRWRRVRQGVYVEGPEEPTAFERDLADIVATDGVATGGLAATLLGLDGIELDGRPRRRRLLPGDRIIEVDGLRCTDGLLTLIDLAAGVDDTIWEQALESALRKHLVTVSALEDALPGLSRSRVPGTVRIRRVLDRRPPGAAPTGSLLETLAPSWPAPSPAWAIPCASSGSARGSSTSRGPTSGCSSSSTASSTSANPSTTPGGRPASWPPPAGCVDDSPGRKSSGSRRPPPAGWRPSPNRPAAARSSSSTPRRLLRTKRFVHRKRHDPSGTGARNDDYSARNDSCAEIVVLVDHPQVDADG